MQKSIGPAADNAARQEHSGQQRSGPRRAQIGQEMPQAMKYSRETEKAEEWRTERTTGARKQGQDTQNITGRSQRAAAAIDRTGRELP